MDALLGGSADSWTTLKDAMHQRVQELKRFCNLRVEDKSKQLFEQELMGLEASVKALEKHVVELRAHMQREKATVPQVEALIEACKLQKEDLNAMEGNLPPHLPGFTSSARQAAAQNTTQPGSTRPVGTGDGVQGSVRQAQHASHAASGIPRQDDDVNAAADKRRRDKEPPPRWYITESELAGLSSYMVGRLTLDKVNSAVDELAVFAESNHKLMAAVKGPGGGKLAGQERKRATDLLHGVASKEGIRGRHWFLESDLREGSSIKLDKTGKSVLTVLRHLGRLQEVRCNVEGTTLLVYVLNHPA